MNTELIRRNWNRVCRRYIQNLTLYLVEINTSKSELLCIDPKSLSMYAFMKMAKEVHPLSFNWVTIGATDIRRFPQLSIGEDTFYSAKELSTTRYAFEKAAIPLGDIEVLEIEGAINDLEDVVLNGLKSCTKFPTWDSRIREIAGELPEAMLMNDLMHKMRLSFTFLCELLEDMVYILDMVYGRVGCPSYLDAMLFGPISVIYKHFGRFCQVNEYCRTVYCTLKEYHNLWAYAERSFAQLIGSLTYDPIDLSSGIEMDPYFITRWFVRNKNLLQREKTIKATASFTSIAVVMQILLAWTKANI